MGGQRSAPARTSRRKGDPQPLSTQPGHSWKYLYERLTEKRFQQLCGALLRHEDPTIRLYPVGMSDGGRDATGRGADGATDGLIYQVKWTKDRIQNPVAWLTKAVEGEAENIERLVTKGATRYVLMTCVAGTSTPDKGTMDRLDSEFATLSERFGIDMQPLWQADIDGMVDAAPDAIKWSYQEMLAGHDLIRFLIHGSGVEGRAAEMRTTLLKVMKNQGAEDAKVKFSQADLDQTPLADVFVDVQAEVVAGPRAAPDLLGLSAYQDRTSGALAYLLTTSMPYTVVRGEPGQGKSTLGQYLCQVHRAEILPADDVSEISSGGVTTRASPSCHFGSTCATTHRGLKVSTPSMMTRLASADRSGDVARSEDWSTSLPTTATSTAVVARSLLNRFKTFSTATPPCCSLMVWTRWAIRDFGPTWSARWTV